MTTTKQVISEIVEKKNLIIECIDCFVKPCDEGNVYHIVEYYHNLEALNDYGNYVGYQLDGLWGTVYCRDSQGNPVWITKRSDDYGEWWEINALPKYYTHGTV